MTETTSTTPKPPAVETAGAEPRPASPPLAVIDIGPTAIRLTIAQMTPSGIRVLEFLQQAVSLGKDTFTSGVIAKSSIEECVQALKSFRRILNEYQVNQPGQLRAVATTAVREAENRDTFLDRIYMATGIHVEVLDEADMTRLTYLSVQAFIRADPALANSRVLITEVGGGSTELLAIEGVNVLLSQTYRLGSLRIRRSLETFRAAVTHERELMENTIQRTVDQMRQGVPRGGVLHMIALGGDTRFAADTLMPGRNPDAPAKLSLKALSKLTNEILALPVDEIARKYKLPYSDAETVGPALLVYRSIAQAFRLKTVIVATITMRHGLLEEMAGGGTWTEEFKEKIIHSAVEVGRRYHFDEDHSTHVTQLAVGLFRDLAGEHMLGPRHELLLTIAGILHDVGLFVSSNNHHKHSMYLIQNSEIFGLSRHDIFLISQIARYHRRGSPKPTHSEYLSLPREERLQVSQMAAILRVADALDLSHSKRVSHIAGRREGDRFVITIPGLQDLSLEQMALQQKGPMFEDVYGLSVFLRRAGGGPE